MNSKSRLASPPTGIALLGLLASAAALLIGPGHPGGAVALSPAVRALRSTVRGASHSPEMPAAPSMSLAFDHALRERLLARLAHHQAWDAATANVFVADGVAIFQGLFMRHADRVASVALARQLPGIRDVRDQRIRVREWQSMG